MISLNSKKSNVEKQSMFDEHVFPIWKQIVEIFETPYLHHSYSRGTGNARRSLNQQSRQPRTEQSPTCWTTSPAEDVCPLPRLQAGCQGFYQEMASECPYGNPSGTEVSLFVPFCRNSTERKKELGVRIGLKQTH